IGETDGSFETFHEHLLQSLIPMTAHERVLAENIITVEWEISQLTCAMRASVRRGVEQDIQSQIINKHRGIYNAEMDKLRKEHQAVRGQSFDVNLSFGDQFEVPYGFDPMPAETEPENLIQRLYSKEPEIRKQANDDLSVTFKHAEDILADQYKNGETFQTHSDRIATLEERRRDLKKDYDSLQQFRPIEGIAKEA
ncbi:MAG: hypothetical protein P8M25_04000, partial [Paracoccaceae bacterium]|nr:hypothetical protein [Paracoccaceae bacterium]